jgi:hypothetical protein
MQLNQRLGVNRGNRTLMREIEQRVKPAVHLFGHNHEGYGIHHGDDVGKEKDDGRRTTFIGCAIKVQANVVRDPIAFDFVLSASRLLYSK